MSIEGHGGYEIAQILTKEKVESPSYYLASRELWLYKNRKDMSRPYDWYGNSVNVLLFKPEYMGHTVNFRTSKKSYKDKRIMFTRRASPPLRQTCGHFLEPICSATSSTAQ